MSERLLRQARLAFFQLSIYRNLKGDPIYQSFGNVLYGIKKDGLSVEELSFEYSELTALLAEEYELKAEPIIGNLWQNHLLELILSDENVFSKKLQSTELEHISPGLQAVVKSDLRCLQILSQIDSKLLLEQIEKRVKSDFAYDDPTSDVPCGDWHDFTPLKHTVQDDDKVWTKQQLLKKSCWEDALPLLAKYYKEKGTGIFSKYQAFRWVVEDGRGELWPLTHTDPVRLDQLVDYEEQKRLITTNTESFLAGYPANNALLFGGRGTGKSSTVKALLNEYRDTDLRMIEVSKEDLVYFPVLAEMLRGQRYRFIVFIDDLSFEEGETQYKGLKAALEGGLTPRPENVLIYATSNRRHLIAEYFDDQQVHPQDSTQEKLSLADRFGLRILYPNLDQKMYLNIVDALATESKLEMDRERLHKMALQWQMQYNGPSGRTARQFITHLIGNTTAKRYVS
ncbi:MAG: ATP-binding protein [Limnochordia bacterium]|jgi:predicted AAA+ superfamily ATPase|nr:ATP-binding protein [Limnochordia bacterium]